MIEKNAITRVLEQPRQKEKYGDRWEIIHQSVQSRCPLDEERDEPLPQWVINLMRESDLPYKTRLKIMATHHFDITHENCNWVFLPTEEARKAPRSVPRWLVDFRERQAQRAKDAIEKLNSKERTQSK